VTNDIRAVIFDIGRVLVRIDLRRVQAGLAQGVKLTPEELWSAIEKDPRWMDWQEGRMSARDWHQNLGNRLGIQMTFEQFKNVWNSSLDPQPIQPDWLLAALAKSYTLGLLSNTDPIHSHYLESTYSFFEHFPKSRRIYSHEVGSSKPSPVIFQHALKACKVRADQALYVDDIVAYVDVARSLGMKGIHYQSSSQLLHEFTEAGVKYPVKGTT